MIFTLHIKSLQISQFSGSPASKEGEEINCNKDIDLYTIPDDKFILIVPTINIATEFYSKLYVTLNNNHPQNINYMIKVC